MNYRCYNEKDPKYKNYGGRGIKVCDEWKNSFRAFADWALNNGYEDPPVDATRSWIATHGLTIDRINSDKGYSPKNCRWITFQQNRENRKANYHYTHPQMNALVEWTKNEAEIVAEKRPCMSPWEHTYYKANTIRGFAAFLVCRRFGVRKMNLVAEDDVPKAREIVQKVFDLVTDSAIKPA